MIALVRKELRQQGLVAGILIVLVVLAYLLAGLLEPVALDEPLRWTILCFTGAFALTILGGLTFAEERRTGTSAFLAALPLSHLKRTAAKLGVSLLLIVGITVAVLAAAYGLERLHIFSEFFHPPTVGLVQVAELALCVGVLWAASVTASASTGNEVPAILLSWAIAPAIVFLAVSAQQLLFLLGWHYTAKSDVLRMAPFLGVVSVLSIALAIRVEIRGARREWSARRRLRELAVFAGAVGLVALVAASARLERNLFSTRDNPHYHWLFSGAASGRVVSFVDGMLRVHDAERGWRAIGVSPAGLYLAAPIVMDPKGETLLLARGPMGAEHLLRTAQCAWFIATSPLAPKRNRYLWADRRFPYCFIHLASGKVVDLDLPKVSYEQRLPLGWTEEGEFLWLITRKQRPPYAWRLLAITPADDGARSRRLDIPPGIAETLDDVKLVSWWGNAPYAKLSGGELQFRLRDRRIAWHLANGRVRETASPDKWTLGFSGDLRWRLVAEQTPPDKRLRVSQDNALLPGLMEVHAKNLDKTDAVRLVAIGEGRKVLVAELAAPVRTGTINAYFLDGHAVLMSIDEQAKLPDSGGAPPEGFDPVRTWEIEMGTNRRLQRVTGYRRRRLVRVALDTGERREKRLSRPVGRLRLSPGRTRAIVQHLGDADSVDEIEYALAMIDTRTFETIGKRTWKQGSQTFGPLDLFGSVWWDENSLAVNKGHIVENKRAVFEGVEIINFATGETRLIKYGEPTR